MTLRTAICELLGVEHPVGNAGMAGVAHARLCAAVADAGGIATVAMGGASAAEVTTRVEAVKALTDRPFSANFIAWLIEHDTSPLMQHSKLALPRSLCRSATRRRTSIGSIQQLRSC